MATATRVTVGQFDYPRAFDEWCFVQLPPLALGDFQRAAKDRGIELPWAERDVWETLDREELLPPVAYALHGFWFNGWASMRQEGSAIIRDENGYQDWARLQERAHEQYNAELYPLYAHWQLLTLAALDRALALPTPWLALEDGLDGFQRTRVAWASQPFPRSELLERARARRREELLLARVQNFFYPRVRGGRYRGGVILGLTDDAVAWGDEQERSFDFAASADECGVTADDLAQLFHQFAANAHWVNPIETWFHLADQVKREERERLTGGARLAIDYYDAARLIRAWHARLGGEPLPDVDETIGIGARSAKERMYGFSDIRNNREALPAILEHFGLYPWRVQLVSEGGGEVAILEEILDYAWGLSFARLGIHSVVVGTADIPKNAELLLAAMRPYANYYFMLFDDEGRARELIDELLRGGHIEGISNEQRQQALTAALEAARQETYASEEKRRQHLLDAQERAQIDLEAEPGRSPESYIWVENLEADNFELDEVIDVVEAEAAQQTIEGFHLGREGLREEVAADPRGMASIVLAAAEAHDPPLRLDKPNLDRLLGRYAVDHPTFLGERHKILRLAEHLVRLTAADRRAFRRQRYDEEIRSRE